FALRWMERVVCVSHGQAAKVRREKVPEERLRVIPNAIQADRIGGRTHESRQRLLGLFSQPPGRIVGAAGRLSPEKGFGVLVEAAAKLLTRDNALGFVLFGEGPQREALSRQIEDAGLEGRFVLGGFRRDLDELLPAFDVLALPSYTEGMP